MRENPAHGARTVAAGTSSSRWDRALRQRDRKRLPRRIEAQASGATSGRAGGTSSSSRRRGPSYGKERGPREQSRRLLAYLRRTASSTCSLHHAGGGASRGFWPSGAWDSRCLWLDDPDAKNLRCLVPLSPEVATYAYTNLIATRPGRRRLVLGALRVGWLARLVAGTLPAAGFAAGAATSRPLFAWLFPATDAGVRSPLAVLSVSWRGSKGSLVAHGFEDGAALPSVVAKVRGSGTPAEDDEAAVIRRLGPAARAAGAAVPEPLLIETGQNRAVLFETPGERPHGCGDPRRDARPGRERDYATDNMARELESQHALGRGTLRGMARACYRRTRTHPPPGRGPLPAVPGFALSVTRGNNRCLRRNSQRPDDGERHRGAVRSTWNRRLGGWPGAGSSARRLLLRRR